MRTTNPNSRNRARRRSSRRGAAVTEFAVVAPLLVLTVVGAIDVGQYVNVAQIVDNASREGARVGVRAATDDVDDVNATVQNYLGDTFPNLTAAEIDAAVEVLVTESGGNAIPAGEMSTISEGSPVEVTVVFRFADVRWVPGAGVVGRDVIRRTTVMRRQ